ncbi:hypothetical protein M9Y10_022118 [Tritrichomonas musculus]|uniref:BZIP domain-containing protein n=1 Tax=Tritrichomonas musculus TaxID=1915356 RepID=A0ABR2KSE4_9EUKA
MDAGGSNFTRPTLGRSRGLLDFNIINTPNRFQQTPDSSQNQKAAEVQSVLNSLPPIGSNQDDRQPIPPRHIILNRFQSNEQNDNSNQQEANNTTPRRLINFNSTSPRVTTSNETLNNNENSSLMNSSGMQNSSVIVFPPLPGETESNAPKLPLNTQSPISNNEIPKPNFQFSNNNQNNQEQSPEFAFESLSKSPPNKQQSSPGLLKVSISPKFQLPQSIQHQQTTPNSIANQVSPIYQQPQAQTQQQQVSQYRPEAISTPKAACQDRLNQSLPPSTVGYSTDYIGSSPKDCNFTEILPRKTPGEYFETSINNSLDRSFSTFKRSVTREISSAFRPNSSVFDVSMFDTFLSGLITDVTSIFEVPPSILNNDINYTRGLNSLPYMTNTNIDNSTTMNITIDNNGSASGTSSNSGNNIESFLTRKLTQSFEENAKPIRKMFADAEVRKAQNREKRIDELKNLNNALNELRTAVKNISDATLQELERERYDAASRRDEEQAKFRSLERRSRSLKLKRADLDSKLNHQKMEKESMERLLKQMDDARHEWEDPSNDSGNTITQKLQKEIENLHNELNNDDTEKLDSLMKECSSLMMVVRDGLRDEIYEMDVAEKWAISRLRSPVRRPPMNRFDPSFAVPQNAGNMQMMPNSMQMQQPASRQAVVQFAQDQINEKRKERELAMREFNNQYPYYSDYGQNQI